MNDPYKKQVGGKHYKVWKKQPVKFIRANKLEFIFGVMIKYIMRIASNTTDTQKQIEDLEKIIHYSRLKQLFLSKDGNNIQHNDDSETSKTF
mgnify:CR=1 FL=1